MFSKEMSGFATGFAALLGALSIGFSSPSFAQDPETLTVYSGVPREQAEQILAEFSKTYPTPVKFNVVKKPDEELLTELNLQQRGGGIKADLLWITNAQALSLQKSYPGVFSKLDSPQFAHMLDSVKKDSYTTAAPYGMLIYAIAYNKKQYTEATSPKSYKDLLDATKYKDKVVMADPRSSGAVHLVFWLITQHLAKEPGYGWDYFDKLNQEAPQYVSGHGSVRDLIISGERPVGIQLTFYMEGPIAKGEAVSWNWPTEGVAAGVQSVSVFSNSKHQKIAKDVVDWMLGTEGQAQIAKVAGLAPINKDVDYKFFDGKRVSDLNLVPVDAAYISEHRADVVRRFQQSIQKNR